MAIVLLGVIAAPILGCISFVRQSVVDARIEAQVQTALRDAVYSTAANGELVSLLLTNTVGATERLVGGTDLIVSTNVSKVGGYSNLYSIKSTATWTQTNTTNRAQTASLETYVISPQS